MEDDNRFYVIGLYAVVIFQFVMLARSFAVYGFDNAGKGWVS